jgi:tripartite ATP-independent transporter DctM subunit
VTNTQERLKLRALLNRIEETVAGLALAFMVALPLAEIVARGLLDTSIRGSGRLVQHLTLWVCFLGAAIAARKGKLLSFATGMLLPEGKLRERALLLSSTVAAGISMLLFQAGVELVAFERTAGTMVTRGLPTWVPQLVMPFSFALIALRIVWRAGDNWKPRAIATLGAIAGAVLGQFHTVLDAQPSWPGLALLLLGTILGGPIFALLGGAAALLFMSDGIPPVAVLVETYRLSVSPTLPAIPLFTLVGFLLAEGGASGRLLALFRALFGWIPGGTAVVCALVCAFFTVFTGGSGVTILALGGLLFPALLEDRYREKFSLGLLTASGSLGLLFPPALPLILYGIVAEMPIEDLFIGGLLPGLLLVALIGAWGMREGVVSRVERRRFSAREARTALWNAKWELLLPVIVFTAIFGGFATLVEAAALTALYTLLIQCFVHRDIAVGASLLRVFRQCIVLIGGVLLILGMAMGFTSYMVDAQIPMQALDWVRSHIDSPLVFLLCLNIFLLLVGCVMDVFSATVVVVPMIVPLGAAFGIDPVHLGIIFVANLELGFLTPPVGLNLFLSSYRFEKPLLEIYRATLPMLLILAIGVLLITYFPPLTTALVSLFK